MKEDVLSKYIENYYTARESNQPLESDSSESQLLYSSLDNMDLIDDEDMNFNIDITSIISRGEEIIQRKKDRKELFLFIISAILFISIFTATCIFVNTSIFIYVQVAIVLLLPLALVPLSYFRIAKEDYR